MCGIIGYVGKKQAAPILLDGLKRLEYRGYDSAGMSLMEGGEIGMRKCKGRIQNLGDLISEVPVSGRIGISHT
ncbi:MAG: glutamine--fructose-6-phosphate transaminase (isomerizing), partial [Verrucomicrobiales bacterium]